MTENSVSKLEKEVRFLKRYAFGSTIAMAVLLLAAFGPVKERVTELYVERINVVEADGSLSMVIANRERIRLVVDSADVARLEFLDEEGNVVARFPE